MSTAEPSPPGGEVVGEQMRVGDLSEEELLAIITPFLPSAAQTPVGTGDDCAVVSFTDARTVVSTDVLVEGHHFRTEWSTGRDVGERAAAQHPVPQESVSPTPRSRTRMRAIPTGA